MSYSENYQSISINANTDLSTKQYYLMTVTNSSGEGRAAVCGDGALAVGVLYNTPAAAGRPATIAISGVVKVKTGGVITAGGFVASSASGTGVAAASGDVIFGIALETAASGDIIPVLILPGNDKL